MHHSTGHFLLISLNFAANKVATFIPISECSHLFLTHHPTVSELRFLRKFMDHFCVKRVVEESSISASDMTYIYLPLSL